jgi:hypothetical protein
LGIIGERALASERYANLDWPGAFNEDSLGFQYVTPHSAGVGAAESVTFLIEDCSQKARTVQNPDIAASLFSLCAVANNLLLEVSTALTEYWAALTWLLLTLDQGDIG